MTRDGRHDATDDAGLLRLARRDRAAFRVLYDRHVVRVHAFLLRRTGDSTAAFELTAQTFSRAWLGRSSDGLSWDCHIGQDAVDHLIISQDFLGEPMTGPGRG